MLSKPAFERFAHKDAARKTEAFFAYVISGEQSANGPKKLRNHAFLSKQVGLPKINLILQKVKIGPKTDIHPVCTKAFSYNAIMCE